MSVYLTPLLPHHTTPHHPPVPLVCSSLPSQHPRAPAHENAAARDASAAAARGWARSQSSRLREKERRLATGEAPSAASQPQSSAVAGDGGGGVSVDDNGAVHNNGNPRSLAGGGGVAVDEGRSSNPRGQGEAEVEAKEERAGGTEGELHHHPSSEEEACLSAGVGAGGVPSMHVVKRDGRREPVMFDKITARIRRLCWGLDERYIDPVLVAQKVRAVVGAVLYDVPRYLTCHQLGTRLNCPFSWLSCLVS